MIQSSDSFPFFSFSLNGIHCEAGCQQGVSISKLGLLDVCIFAGFPSFFDNKTILTKMGLII